LEIPPDPPSPEKPLPDFDLGLVPRLQKEGGLKKVDQVLDIFFQNTKIYMDNLHGKLPGAPSAKAGEISFWSATNIGERAAEEQLPDEEELLKRLRQLADRSGANALATVCEDILKSVAASKKPLVPAQLARLDQEVSRARKFMEDARKKL
jgi:hypothetical protein